MENFPLNLTLLRKKANLTQTQLGAALGVGQTNISNWEKGVSVPDIKMLTEIASYFRIPLEELIATATNIDTNVIDITKEPAVKYEVIPVGEQGVIMHVPLVTEAARAGYLRGMGDAVFVERLPKITWEVERMPKGNYVAFDVVGDSMDDGTRNSYLHRDRVLAREIAPHLWHSSRLHYRDWDFVILTKTEGIIIKQIVEHDLARQIIRVHSLNPAYHDYEIALADVVKIFNVVQIVRRRI
jgi:transcriptional regulator with XRE-family HTH domain